MYKKNSQKTLSRKLRQLTPLSNTYFVFSSIPGTYKMIWRGVIFAKLSCHLLSFVFKTESYWMKITIAMTRFCIYIQLTSIATSTIREADKDVLAILSR